MKLNQVVGVVAKEEAVYGTAEVLSNTDDGCLPYLGDGDLAPPEPVQYVFGGDIGRAPATLAPQKRAAPNGLFRSFVFRALPRGRGSAYSGSNTPPNEIHRFLKAAGYDATYSASPTPQWLYTPSAAGPGTGLTVLSYAQGSVYQHAGVLADFGWESRGLGVPIWSFDCRGIVEIPEDDALPTITYPQHAILPPVAAGVVVTIGDFLTATLKGSTLKRQRSIDNPNIAQNLAGGHAGFVPGASRPVLTLIIAQTAEVASPYHTADGLYPEALRAAATSIPVSIQFGSVQYFRHKYSMANAQLIDVRPGNDGQVATWELDFAPHPSTPSANDFDSILFN